MVSYMVGCENVNMNKCLNIVNARLMETHDRMMFD